MYDIYIYFFINSSLFHIFYNNVSICKIKLMLKRNTSVMRSVSKIYFHHQSYPMTCCINISVDFPVVQTVIGKNRIVCVTRPETSKILNLRKPSPRMITSLLQISHLVTLQRLFCFRLKCLFPCGFVSKIIYFCIRS